MQFGILYLLIHSIILVGVTIWLLKRKTATIKPINEIPEQFLIPTKEEQILITIYQTEWKAIIDTQMHFNDLIIRFRAIVLTAFVTMVGASAAFLSQNKMDESLFKSFIFIILVFWITAFLLDLFYYHRLLLGSVAQAMKFDQSQIGKKYGLFGLTTCIAESVHPPASSNLIYMFYGFPAMTLMVLLVFCLI